MANSKSENLEQNQPFLSPKVKPQNMSLVEWQFALRRQFGQENAFEVKNVGVQKVYSDFDVFNPQTHKHYKVAIRSQDNSLNFCNCNDFKTNGLSTCKHIEYVLFQIRKYPPYYKILLAGYKPDYSSIYLKYGAEREIMLRIGTAEKEKFEALARKYFNKDYTLKNESYASIHELVKQASLINKGFRIYDDALEFILERRAFQKRQEEVANFFKEGVSDQAQIKIFKNPVLEYEKQGAISLLRAGKAIIADEYSLNRYSQILVASELFVLCLQVKKILILCPSSKCSHWQFFIKQQTFSTVGIIEKEQSLANSFTSLYQIVSFESLVLQPRLLDGYQPTLVVVDEANRLNNYPISLFEIIKNINSKYSIVSALSNIDAQPDKLYTQMQLIDIFKLGPRYQFIDKYCITNDLGEIVGYKNLHNIPLILNDSLLKRTQKQVSSQLLSPQSNIMLLPFTKAQWSIYQNKNLELKNLVKDWKQNSQFSENDRQKLALLLDNLRKLTVGELRINEVIALIEQIQGVKNQKIIILTHWEKIAKQATQVFHSKNISFLYIDQETSPKDRSNILLKYGRPHTSQLLIAVDKSLEGMNMPPSDVLIHLDFPITKEVQEKRLEMTNSRIKPLSVYFFISPCSIEEKLFEIQLKKSTSIHLNLEFKDIIFRDQEWFYTFMKVLERLVVEDRNNSFVQDLSAQNDIKSDYNTSKQAVQLSFFEFGDEKLEEYIPEKQPKSIKKNTISHNGQNELFTYIIKEETTGKYFLKIPLPDLESCEEVIRLLKNGMDTKS